VRTHCEVWGEFVQVVTKRQVVEEEVSMVSGGNVAGGGRPQQYFSIDVYVQHY